MCTGMKIESIVWYFKSKKDKSISLLVIDVIDAKMANIVIEKCLILDYILHECMRYNPACRMKQYLNCYKYGYVSVYCPKSIKCKACLGSHKTSYCLLCNGIHMFRDKWYEYEKKLNLRMEVVKQNTLRQHKTSSAMSL